MYVNCELPHNQTKGKLLQAQGIKEKEKASEQGKEKNGDPRCNLPFLMQPAIVFFFFR